MRMVKPEDLEFDIFVDEENMIIQATATVYDAVPVVRCRDCLVKQICRYKTGLGDNGFCSQGERRTDET